MKLKDIFVIEAIDDKQIMVSLDSTVLDGLIRSNETAAFIVDHLKEETTEEQIAKALTEAYVVSEEEALKHVKRIVKVLVTAGAIEK